MKKLAVSHSYKFTLEPLLAARLEALIELHPDKTREQVISDIFSLGLSQVLSHAPTEVPSEAATQENIRLASQANQSSGGTLEKPSGLSSAIANNPVPQMAFLPDSRHSVYLLNTPFAEFHGLVYKHHLALEQTLNSETEISQDQ